MRALDGPLRDPVPQNASRTRNVVLSTMALLAGCLAAECFYPPLAEARHLANAFRDSAQLEPTKPTFKEPTAQHSAQWHQFRGPSRSGSIEGNWQLQPSEATQSVLWRRPLGPGFSGVVLGEGRLFTCFSEDDSEYLGAFDPKDGSELWRLPIGPVFRDSWGDGPRSTPTLSGSFVIALGSYGRLVVADAHTGHPVWSKELRQLDGIEPPHFGYSPSPLVWGDLVITEVGASERGLIRAFRLEDGETAWSTQAGRAGYSSPILADLAGQMQAVFVTRADVLGLAADGSVLWSWPFSNGSAFDLPIASAVAVGGDQIFVSHRAEGGSALLKVSRSGEDLRAWTVWESERMLNHMSSSVVDGNTLFGFHNATLQAVSLHEAAITWRKRGLGKGSIIRVGQSLVVMSETGELFLYQANPTELTEVFRLKIFDHRTWTPPSWADDVVYLRSPQELVALSLPAVANTHVARHQGGSEHEALDSQRPSLALKELLKQHQRGMKTSLPNSQEQPEEGDAAADFWAQGTYSTNGLPSAWFAARRGDRLERFRPAGPYSQSEALLEQVTPQGGWALYPDSETPRPMAPEHQRGLELELDLLYPLLAVTTTTEEGSAQSVDHFTYSGVQDFDTGRGHLIEVSRPGAPLEQWYLSPETFRPLALLTQRFCWGRVRGVRYYFSDWRPVGPHWVPFRIEDEFGSFHRVLQLDAIELNSAPDDTAFQPTLAPETTTRGQAN